MNKLFSALIILSMSFLMACNGSSGKNDAEPGPPVVTTLTLSTLDSQGNSQQSFEADKVITVLIKVTDDSNAAMANKRVDVTTDIGQLSSPSKLTNEQGIAELTINNDEFTLGAGTLVAEVDTVSSSIDYEFIQNDTDIGTPSLALSMSVNGITTNQFKADELAQIAMTLLDREGLPIANELINLTADVGLLAASTTFNNTALTNSSGKAAISLSGLDLSGIELLGAGAITATAAHDNSITNRLNYQIIPSSSVVIDDVRIGHFNENDQFI